QARYQFLKWGMQAFNGFKVVPPGIGIVHQVNLEYLAHGVLHQDDLYYPDTLVGTDSHTTMINGLGIVGWGVGGIEAEAGMLVPLLRGDGPQRRGGGRDPRLLPGAGSVRDAEKGADRLQHAPRAGSGNDHAERGRTEAPAGPDQSARAAGPVPRPAAPAAHRERLQQAGGGGPEA